MATRHRALVDAMKKLFLTAYHVIEGATEAKIYFPRKRRRWPAHCHPHHYLDKERPSSGEVIFRAENAISPYCGLRSLPASVTVLPWPRRGGSGSPVYTVGNPGVKQALSGFIRKAPSVNRLQEKFRMTTAKTWEAWMLEAADSHRTKRQRRARRHDKVELVGVIARLAPKHSS